MKKRARLFVLLAVLAVVVIVAGGFISQGYLIPHSFHALSDAKGGIDIDDTFLYDRTLSYGSGPPTIDGEIWEKPLTDEILTLLEEHHYWRAFASSPKEDGVTFEDWDGCCVCITAYWDGTHLWTWGREGCIPYTPSAGFRAEVDRLVNTK